MGHLNAEDEPVVGVREIAPVCLAVQKYALVVGYREEFCEVLGLPHEAVGVVDDDVADLSVCHRLEHFLPPEPLAVAVALPR